jgi:hypothetical protein
MRKLILRCLTALAALAHAAVSPSRAADDLTSNDLASQLRGRCVHDGAMIAHYGIDGSYLVSGLLASGQAFSRSGTWSAHGNQRTPLLRRWGLATRLSRRHARRQDPLCLRRRNLRWRHASTEGRRRLSHVLRRSLIVRHESFQAGRPHGAPEGIVTAFKPCRAFNGRLANADSDFFPHAAVYNTFNVQRHLVSAKTHRASH